MRRENSYIELQCAECGVTFNRDPRNTRPAKKYVKSCCSRVCAAKWAKKTRRQILFPKGEKISHDLLKIVLSYDPEKGVFYRRKNGSPIGVLIRRGYANIRLGKRSYGAHRLAWFYVHGEWPSLQIDHINKDRADNRISNLRLATASQNQANSGPQRNSKSGIRGVSWNARDKRWIASIKCQGKTMHLGSFLESTEASAAYRKAALKYFGEFASVTE